MYARRRCCFPSLHPGCYSSTSAFHGLQFNSLCLTQSLASQEFKLSRCVKDPLASSSSCNRLNNCYFRDVENKAKSISDSI